MRVCYPPTYLEDFALSDGRPTSHRPHPKKDTMPENIRHLLTGLD